MWELINFKTVDYDNRVEVETVNKYLLRNVATKEQKWVNIYEYSQFRRLGLMKEDNN